jgi:hypothetical protein
LVDIWRACRDGDLDLVRILIREGQDKDEQTQNLKNTPLHIAARHGHFLIVKYLIDLGANSLIQNRDGQTAFQFTEEALKSSISSKVLSTMGKGRPGSAVRPPSASGKASHGATSQAQQKTLLENVEGIKRLLAKSQEGL